VPDLLVAIEDFIWGSAGRLVVENDIQQGAHRASSGSETFCRRRRGKKANCGSVCQRVMAGQGKVENPE
jgi:hypothetical protein